MKFRTIEIHTEQDYGWLRVLGFGAAWKPATARAYFSERNGFEKWYTVLGRRVHLLTPLHRWRQGLRELIG